MKAILYTLPFLFISACASIPHARETDLSTQQEGITVSCSGYKSWPDCDRYAANACPQGYDILSREENIVMQARSLRISCKK